MKSAQKITRLQLSINPNDEFILFGIVSTEPDYKLSLEINRRFRINLKSVSPVQITETGNQELTFSRFTDTLNSPELIFSLFSNRSDKFFLVRKLKNVDYLFLIHDTENEIKDETVASGLREIGSITAVFNIDIKSLKDKYLQQIIQ